MNNEILSPDGALKVEFQSNEVRVSYWVNNPRVTYRGELLLDLWVSDASAWGAWATFDAPDTVTLHLREYPEAAPGFDIRIDAGARTWKAVRGQCPAEMKRWLDKALSEVR